MSKVSCIMPAYNEAQRIGQVLDVVYKHPLLDEIIVIDDGSTDDTKKIVEKFKDVKLISNIKNSGKSISVYNGIKEAKNPFIFLLDTDLIGLTAENITALINPVLSGETEISISVRRISAFWDKFYKIYGMDFFSGERVIPVKILDKYLHEIPKLPGFGLETFFNKIIAKHNYPIKVVFWDNVRSPLKYKKRGAIQGFIGDFLMVRNILKTANLLQLLKLFIKMRKLIVY